MKVIFVAGVLLLVLSSIYSFPLDSHSGESDESDEDICLGEPDGTKFPQRDCRKFILCVRGDEKEVSCPKGELFDYMSRHCMSRRRARCWHGQTTLKTTTTRKPTRTTKADSDSDSTEEDTHGPTRPTHRPTRTTQGPSVTG
jgi:hypothetical protein